MELRSLEMFLALSDTLHFGRASERCHISASALSRHIARLEGTLGIALFERDNRHVALTAQGRQFTEYARETVTGWHQIRDELLEQATDLHGEISLFCSVTASYSFLYDILSKFRQQHPRIEIKLHTGAAEDALQRVVAGHEDITIAARPDRLPADLAFRPITTTPLVFVAPLDMALPTRSPRSPAPDWAQIPMILSEHGVARERVNAWFRRRRVSPRIYAQVAGNEAIVSMVSLGFGVGVVPQIVLDNSPLAQRVRVLQVSPKLPPYHVGLFTSKRRLRSPLIRALWSQLSDAKTPDTADTRRAS